jgi:signal transduction histidine kinase
MAQNSWEVVPYEGSLPFKRVRIRHSTWIRKILSHVYNHDYVVILAPHYSEKTRLLQDVITELEQNESYRPIYIDLWRVKSDDERAFFESLQVLVRDSFGVNHYVSVKILEDLPTAYDARSFQVFLQTCLENCSGYHVMVIDHLHALPSDLIYLLLKTLRAVRMELSPDIADHIVVVITGGVLLSDLSRGPTSPFNIAKPITLPSLDDEQSLAIVTNAWQALDVLYSQRAAKKAARLAGGDPYILGLLCHYSYESVQGYRQQRIDRGVVGRAADRIVDDGPKILPINEALQIIEADTDTMLDVLDILREGRIVKNRVRQRFTTNGVNQLLLSGAVVLDGSAYRIKHEIYRRVLEKHFSPGHVVHVLRVNGRWPQAIDYLNSLPQDTLTESERHALLLETIVQSLYAADTLDDAYQKLVEGMKLVFQLDDVCFFHADTARHELRQIYGKPISAPLGRIPLHEESRVEVQTFLNGGYALRGHDQDRRLVAALVPEKRPIGVVTVEHYWRREDREGQPPTLTAVRRFLRSASGALEDVMQRVAFRAIGRAVLNVEAVGDGFGDVLRIVASAVGGDAAILYLIEQDDMTLKLEAKVPDDQVLKLPVRQRILLDEPDPAARCLDGWRQGEENGDAQNRPKPLLERCRRLSGHACVFVPLIAAGDELGVLQLGFELGRSQFGPDEMSQIEAFADQVAIAVYNMQLLRRTDESLTKRVQELTKLQDINRALVSTLDVESVLQRIIENLCDLYENSAVTIWRYDEETKTLSVSASSLDDPAYRQAKLDLSSFEGQALNRPDYVSDFDDMDRHQNPVILEMVARLDVRGAFAIPMTHGDERLGVITIYLRDEFRLDNSQRHMLTTIADQATVAIINARQYEQLIEAERKLRISRDKELYDIANVLRHRLGNAVGDIPHHLNRVRKVCAQTDKLPEDALVHIKRRVDGLRALTPAFDTIIELNEVEFERLDLRSVIDEACDHALLCHGRDIDWSPPPGPVLVEGNGALLCDAFQSVLENGCEAMDAPGKLRVALQTDRNGIVRVRVIDSGVGVPDNVRERIFEPGFTSKETGAADHGRGLFTCRAIMRKHRGDVELIGSGNAGSVFEIWLPSADTVDDANGNN